VRGFSFLPALGDLEAVVFLEFFLEADWIAPFCLDFLGQKGAFFAQG